VIIPGIRLYFVCRRFFIHSFVTACGHYCHLSHKYLATVSERWMYAKDPGTWFFAEWCVWEVSRIWNQTGEYRIDYVTHFTQILLCFQLCFWKCFRHWAVDFLRVICNSNKLQQQQQIYKAVLYDMPRVMITVLYRICSWFCCYLWRRKMLSFKPTKKINSAKSSKQINGTTTI